MEERSPPAPAAIANHPVGYRIPHSRADDIRLKHETPDFCWCEVLAEDLPLLCSRLLSPDSPQTLVLWN
ncbi:hypothetical protein CEXT_722351 [Caerostris extrusa]|uniref:Uncharacterized protein n=1 Tax=Caerostris extrusa TaxID=172846 RepID=A0AAV4QWL7_CAEEX|nr:hypothetical protein CEXT_722351 [Caerostris extrusa]